MYSQINIVKDIEPEAEQFILNNDRMLYLPFFERVEKFCIDNSVLIGGRVGIDLLVGRGVTKDSFNWELYCDDTFNNAKALADDLCRVDSPHIPARTTALRTDIRHKEFTLSVNTRMLFKIYSMDKYRNIKLVDLMGPAVRTSYFLKEPIKLISEEMQLVEIYRTLYSPKKLSMWAAELTAEEKIYDMISLSLGEKAIRTIKGAAEKFNRAGAESIILRKIIAGSDNVLIGDHALSMLGMVTSPSRLQFISAASIDKISREIEQILHNDTRAVKVKSVKVTYVRYPLNIPSDFQITKHTIYASSGREQIPIADVFNSSVYELIPYWDAPNDATIKIGNPWVLLRFMFIDVWVLKLILNLGTDNPDFIKNKIKYIIDNAGRVRELARDCVTNEPEKVFQLSNYAGNFIDEHVAKKKMIKEIGERFPIYYPAKNITGREEIPASVPELTTSFTSAAINMNEDINDKMRILQKIIGRDKMRLLKRANIINILKAYHGSAREYSHWGINKNIEDFKYRNASLLPYIPQVINDYLDFGCGDGLDIAYIRSKYNVRTAICADIADQRDDKYKGESSMLDVKINQPLDLPDASIDFITMFHVIHHCADAAYRLGDIARVITPGGILLVRDHDVRTNVDARNVDFEHMAYLVGEGDNSIDELINNFARIEPMYYFSAENVSNFLENVGFERLFYEGSNGPTRVYRAAFRKK